MNNMDIYNKLRKVPDEAKKTIGAGRLKGFTDINPMWRIKALTETFGPCGIGWWYEITDKRIEAFQNEIKAFVDIKLFYIVEGRQSWPVVGTGGASFVTMEKSGPYVSDECFKMALTDAISVAAKSLGVGADVYYEKDRDKYTAHGNSKKNEAEITKSAKVSNPAPQNDANVYTCEYCHKEITKAEAEYSKKTYGYQLCREHQELAKKKGVKNG